LCRISFKSGFMAIDAPLRSSAGALSQRAAAARLIWLKVVGAPAKSRRRRFQGTGATVTQVAQHSRSVQPPMTTTIIVPQVVSRMFATG